MSWWMRAILRAAVAFANATSSAQLAALHPQAGGTYTYGRARLSPVWGFAAGWGFVVGKTASCAAMALTFGSYAWPDHPRLTAALAVVALVAVNLAGVTKTVWLTRVIVVVVLCVLAVVVAAGFGGGTADIDRIGRRTRTGACQAASARSSRKREDEHRHDARCPHTTGSGRGSCDQRTAS